MPSWIRSVCVCPGTLGSTHKSCCHPGSVVLMVPHTAVVGLGVLDIMSCLIFFRILLWTWGSWGFSPVPLHLMVPSVCTISGGKKFPNFLPYKHLPYKHLPYKKKCLATICCKVINISLSAHTSSIEESGEQYLCIHLTTSFMFCKPLSYPSSAFSSPNASKTFQSLFISRLHHSLHRFNCHSL